MPYFENDNKEELSDLLESKAAELGMDKWVSINSNARLLNEQIGLCSKCNNLSFMKTEFGNVLAQCCEFKIRLSGQNRVTECNMYSERGKMCLRDMESIAIILDFNDKKVGGFISK